MTRISATKGDTGYGQYLVCQTNGRWPKVMLDGSEVENVITADDDLGLIVQLVMDETNRPVIDRDREGFVTSVSHGTVQFVWPSDAENAA